VPAVTRIALLALDRLGGPRTVVAAVPGGVRAIAAAAGVTPGRVSQVLRQDPLPEDWARLLADLIGCGPWEVYQQLGQRFTGSAHGPLFDEPRLRSNSA
jgi:hypothetical protein